MFPKIQELSANSEMKQIHIEDTQMLGVTLKQATGRNGFVQSCLKIWRYEKYYTQINVCIVQND